MDPIDPVVYLDGIVINLRDNIRDNLRVINQSICLALGVNRECKKDGLGLWRSENEGTTFGLSMLTELKNPGVQDMLMACVDGLQGLR